MRQKRNAKPDSRNVIFQFLAEHFGQNSSRNVGHEQPIGQTLLEVMDHRRLISR
jgi:hypothetical protein